MCGYRSLVRRPEHLHVTLLDRKIQDMECREGGIERGMERDLVAHIALDPSRRKNRLLGMTAKQFDARGFSELRNLRKGFTAEALRAQRDARTERGATLGLAGKTYEERRFTQMRLVAGLPR